MARRTKTAGEKLRERLTDEVVAEASAAGFTFVWEQSELVAIDVACAVADEISKLEDLLEREGRTVLGAAGQSKLNPVIGELRAQRDLLARMVGRLRFPDFEDAGAPKNFVKQAAAKSRWAN